MDTSPGGDHLARYLDAHTSGRLPRAWMADVLWRPQLLMPPWPLSPLVRMVGLAGSEIFTAACILSRHCVFM